MGRPLPRESEQVRLAAQNYAAEIKIRAERRAGELLAEMQLKPGPKEDAFTLQAIGLSQVQSHRWQRLASIPEGVLESNIEETVEAGGELIKARRLLEVRWGELLGPAKPGPPESSTASEDSSLTPNQRMDFREFAKNAR